MKILPAILAAHDEVSRWRRDIHAHPETAFEEHRTAQFVAEKLESFGLEVCRGIAGTGVIGNLKRGGSDRAVGLRADMDALFIQEANDFPHRSRVDGKMHACGHDGHTAMLLGAAQYLARHGNFDGTIRFIFQPAEETGDERCGGHAMVLDKVFERFPVGSLFGMHNHPNLALGHFAVRPGPMLASIDTFEFRIRSENAHPGQQHRVADPILVASGIVQEAHLLKARYVDPAEPVILSITQFQSGNPLDRQSVHVTPTEAFVRGTLYTLNDSIRDLFETRLREIVAHAAKSAGADHTFGFERGYPALINAPAQTRFAAEVAASIVGEQSVEANMKPTMGAEDFAFLLREVPGCYVFLGTGGGQDVPCHLHNPHFDFNDAAVPVGVQYWVTLAERYLRSGG